MTDSKRPLKVFLCYAHIIPLRDEDRDAVKALYERLTTPPRRVGAGEDGVDVWLDKEKLILGQDWERENCN